MWVRIVAGSSSEPSPVECRDLIRGLLQLHPGDRLDLQQVAAHCWMLPAEHMLSSVLGATRGGEWLTGKWLGCGQGLGYSTGPLALLHCRTEAFLVRNRPRQRRA